MSTKLDRTALRFNQATIIVLLLIAFLTNQAWLVAFVAAVMLVGTLWPRASLFKVIYTRLPRSAANLLRPEIVVDDPAPHLFAQGLGGLTLLVSATLLLTSAQVIGWLAAALVVALAATTLFFDFCVGCFLYYQLARRGIRLSLPAWPSA